MNKDLPFIPFVFLITLGFLLSPAHAMEKEEKGTKRTYLQTQLYDDYETRKLKRFTAKREAFTFITRLSTPEAHIRCLQEGIKNAQNSILITSYGVDHEAFTNGDLHRLLAEASQRGVKIYIYNIDSKDTDDVTFKFFCKYNIAFDAAFTHAKIFAVDDRRVAIGSYSWLSKSNTWENATFHIIGKECTDIVPLLWEDLKYYRNLQFGNLRQIEEYEDNSENDEADTWELDETTELHYIHTLNTHRDFIADVFQNVKRKVVFCAPFINPNSGYQEDFSKKLLGQTLRRGVHIYFVCRAEDPNFDLFKNHLGSLLDSPYMHLLSLSNIHLKTVLVDDETIAEGSFNWLSASRDEGSEYHNHEVTLILDGQKSTESIQNFYASLVGQEITKCSTITMLPTGSQLSPVEVQKPEVKKVPIQDKGSLSSPIQKNMQGPALEWKRSTKGNPYTNISKGIVDNKEHHIVITKSRNNSYSAIIDNVSLGKWYPSEDEAKNAALDYLK